MGPVSGIVKFAAGETSRTVTVKAIGDVKLEPNETFFVQLTNPSGALIIDPTGTGTIANDDGP